MSDDPMADPARFAFKPPANPAAADVSPMGGMAPGDLMQAPEVSEPPPTARAQRLASLQPKAKRRSLKLGKK